MKLLKNLKHAVLTLGKRGQHNGIKVLCLGLGLAVGAVLMAKVWLIRNCDTFYPDADRLYVVGEAITMNGEYGIFQQTPGAIGPGLKRYAPQVAEATRWTWLEADATVVTEDFRRLKVNAQFADSCFFDVLARPVIAGNPREVLARPGYCMVPRSVAEAIGGDVLGQKLHLHTQDGYELVIGGVYEDFPVNSMNRDLGVLVHIHNIGDFSGDGTGNWMGNDRYKTFVKLVPGVGADDLRPQIEQMMQENIPMQQLSEAGVEFDFVLTPLGELNMQDSYARRMAWILSLLAFVLIFSAVMNYLLIVIGGMGARAREMAVHKCYGAEEGDIYGIVFSEAVVQVVLSVVLAGVLLYASKGTLEYLADAPLGTLLVNGGTWMLVAVCLGVLVLTGLVPGWLYSRVPVMTAFRGYTQAHHRWKFWLLAVQFVAAGFLFALLFVIQRQYDLMIHFDAGYAYDNLVHVNLSEVDRERRGVAVDALKSIPGVEGVTTSYQLLTEGASGNNIYLPGDDRQYLNVSDLYDVGNGYVDVMGLTMLQGRDISDGSGRRNDVMVSRRFVERMKELAGWDDNVVGRQIIPTGHDYVDGSLFTICGVYEDVMVGSIMYDDRRPTIMFHYDDRPQQHLYVRFRNLSAADVAAVDAKLKELYPNQELAAQSYTTLVTNLYHESRKFRDTVMIGGLVTLMVALIGLIGYTNNEVARRHKEIAIRKVNGAQTFDVLRLFMNDILRIALPSLIVGGVGAYIVAGLWQQQFAEKASLSLALFVGSGVAVLAVILLVVNVNCLRVARSNPVEYLKERS